jgi:predicted transport protein
MTGGPGRTVPGGVVQTGIEIEIQIQTLQINFQTVSNFDQIEKYFPRLRKIEINFGFEDLREVNNFLHRNISRLGMVCELEFRESSVS